MDTWQDCERFLEEYGLASVLPGKAGLLPCLLWAAQGEPRPISGDDPAFLHTWSWKDELPGRKLAWAGRLWGAQVVLVHRRLLPALLGHRGPLEVEELYTDGLLSQDAFRLWEALRDSASALGRKPLRTQLGWADKPGASRFDRACRDLERLLVITRAGSVALASGWDSNSYALVERHFAEIQPLPRGRATEEIREALARAAPQAAPAQRERWLKALG